MKTLLLLTNAFPHGRGEEFLESEIPFLAERFDHIVIVPSRPEGSPTRCVPDGTRILDLNFMPRGGKWSMLARCLAGGVFRRELADFVRYHGRLPGPAMIREDFAHLVNARLKADRIASLLDREEIRPDLVYSYWNHRDALAALGIKQRLGIPAVSRAHGYDVLDERSPFGHIPFKSTLADGLDGIFFNTDYTRGRFMAKTGPRSCFHTARLGVFDGGEPNPGSSDGVIRLVSCSDIVPLKRVDRIVAALARWDGPPLHWTHIGTGPLESSLRTMADTALRDHPLVRHRFAGYLPNSAVREFHRSGPVDLFVSMTATEGGAPVSMMEAFAAGIPVIAPAVGGVPEIVVHRENGFLLAGDATPAQLLEALRAWVALNPADRTRIRESALARQRERFDAMANYAEFADSLYRLAGGSR